MFFWVYYNRSPKIRAFLGCKRIEERIIENLGSCFVLGDREDKGDADRHFLSS
jgi:hypothetical protein